MRLRAICSAFALTVLAACGGGGGGGGGGTPPVGNPTSTPSSAPTATPVPYATLAPASSRQGDVKTLAVGAGANAIAYWPDYNIVVVAAGNAIVNAADGTVLATAGDNNNVSAVAYSANTHSIVFATPTDIYSKGTSGPVLTVAINTQHILSLAAAADGTVYAFDTDHIIKIAGGVPENVTAPGSLGYSYDGATPSLAVASDGSLLVSDPLNDAVWHVTSTGTIIALAGSCKNATGVGPPNTAGVCWRVSQPGTGTNANFGAPGGVAYDAATGTLYVADTFDNELWSVSASGVAQPVAGYGAPINVDANGLSAFLWNPSSITFQSASKSVDILEYASNSQQEIAAYSTAGSAAPAAIIPATKIYVPNGLLADALAASPDGGAWAADPNGASADRISPTGSITKYASSNGIHPTWHVAVDANGNAWYLASHMGSSGVPVDQGILEVTPSGAQTYSAAAPQHAGASNFITMEAVTIGPDGNPWFTESETSLYGGSFGFVNAATHAVTQYATSTVPNAIAPGPGGTIAVGTTSNSQPAIDFAALNGQVTATHPTTLYSINSLQYRSSDSTLWFTDVATRLASFTAAGSEHDYTVCGNCDPVNLTVAPDGSIWSDEGNWGGGIVRITPTGQVLQYLLPTNIGASYGISARPDGKLWVYQTTGVLFLFDPAAYDAMNGPHPAQPAARRGESMMRSRWHMWASAP